MKRKDKKHVKPEQGTSDIRKVFYRRLLYIALGIIPILLVWEKKGPERYIGLAGFVFSMSQFLLIIRTSQLIVDDFFPPKNDRETRTKPFDKFMYYFAMTIFFGGLGFELFEIRAIDNTIYGLDLFWKSAFVGVLIAILLTIIIKLTSPSVYYESSRRFSVHLGLLLGFFLLIPALASFINRHYADNKTQCQTFEIMRKSIGGRRHRSSWLFLKFDKNSEQRFEVSREFYDQVDNGGQVKLCTKKGKLGYDFVEEFKTPNE